MTVPGPEVERLAKIARQHRVHLVVGLIERVGTTLYCAAVTVDDAGEVVGRRRKVMPTGERTVGLGTR